MKNFDETRRALVYAGWTRCDQTKGGVHEELWRPEWAVDFPVFSYFNACSAQGITPSSLVFLSHQVRGPRPPRPKKLQAKHLDTRSILQAVSDTQNEFYDEERTSQKSWATIYDLENKLAWFKELPYQLVRAKMKALIRNGLLDGCTCGCRGDYEMTNKGREFLEQPIVPIATMNGRQVTYLGWIDQDLVMVFVDEPGRVYRFTNAHFVSLRTESDEG